MIVLLFVFYLFHGLDKGIEDDLSALVKIKETLSGMQEYIF